jgi:hypothetical protein
MSRSNDNNQNGQSGPKGQRQKGGGSHQAGADKQGDDKARTSRRRKGSRKKKVDPQVFWGDPAKLAEHNAGKALITSNPSAVVQSLGRPPLSGQQNAAEHYFIAVYERAVNLAAALAAAGNLIEPEELTESDRLGA